MVNIYCATFIEKKIPNIKLKKKYICCPRDWRLSASWGPNEGPPIEPLKSQYDSAVMVRWFSENCLNWAQ